ncbi:Alpha/beta-hydrolase [Madurella fahalii]|uniref:Alpha/beta-hydrolase n=1 Tax=Madurella fahalii TaxID=1157608 RepID=A0ABQ0GK11_9PEZI
MARGSSQPPHNDGPTDGGRQNDGAALKRQVPPLLSKVSLASYIYGIKGMLAPIHWLRDWREYFSPPEGHPNIVKAYESRPGLPVRIFFPSSYDQTSPTTLPTLFTIHGGGFCIGCSRDDDEWNRAFADAHHVLVIALNYSKAPAAPFPAAPRDVEALLLSALADDSLPIDHSRTAILGFSAGGNLALSVSQLPAVRAHRYRPRAAVSVYGCLDLSVPPPDKLRNRPWKPALLPPPRGDLTDPLSRLAPAFDWGYIPYGHDLRDPLLSPAHCEVGEAGAAALPPFVCLVAAELDMLAHESWRLACRLSRRGRVVPDRESADARWRVCGREEGEGEGVATGLLELGDERFAFEETWAAGGGGGGVKWLLVPDVLHGFDNVHIRSVVGGKEAMDDAERKTAAYTAELARWLKEVVWKL